jgi:hypothetical protein
MNRKHSARNSISLGLVTLCLLLPVAALATDETALYQETPTTGTSILKKVAVGGRLPIGRTYEQLSDEHKQIVKSYYNSMPQEDEPPYPKYGLISIYKPLVKLQERFQGRGDIEMYVTVDAEGRPRSVSVYKTPDADVSKAIASVLMLTEFKPAVCNGKPCTMEFPLVLTLAVTH